ncbi:Helix-turn-helix [Ruminococcus sp. YE71]|uniref:helix-turn-helix domain-containing protein n=1 Tax=unclassified Ruminococcus TaxID=2608920 RepID=UPI000887DF02|nr:MULTISPECIES: helix-turn-helix domain-containing protein [unclassified Ruminococcus]SDA15780.1 Helix-turn-helix [Ruminococcus sp. YE78]SFW23178.1 Helix-turn-helix [Ruminococcus sp. YE71]
MDQIKTGALIRALRLRNNMTQKQLAERLNVSDKAVSKWECANGCPDISMLTELAEVFGTDVQTLLSGGADCNESEVGNMNKLRFYICKDCGNIITASSDASITCCGNRLTAAEPRRAEDGEKLRVENIGGELYVTSDHEMTKEHYISFVAYQSDSCLMMFRQYPEWAMQARLPLFRTGRLVWYCNRCGLLYGDLRRLMTDA